MSTLTDSEAFAAIVAHGLSVRQISLKVVSTLELRHKEDGDEVIHQWGRKMVRRVKVPHNAGYWMTQQVNSTSASVQWSMKTDNLAATLAESVALFLATL